jgi:hypothetical protein
MHPFRQRFSRPNESTLYIALKSLSLHTRLSLWSVALCEHCLIEAFFDTMHFRHPFISFIMEI